MKKIYYWFKLLLVSLALSACEGDGDVEPSVLTSTIISSNITETNYQIDVYVPDTYIERQGPLPVIYASDGQATSEIYALLLRKYGEKIILVAIHEGPKERRNIDYLPPGVDNYYLFLTQELIPDVESRFDIEPQQRTLVGHSFGGVMASYVMLYEEIGAEFFHNYIISDASFWRVPDEIYELEAQRYLQSDILDVNVVFSGTTGSLGNYEGVSEFYDFIKNRPYQQLNMAPLLKYRSSHGNLWFKTFQESLPILFPMPSE